MEPEAAISTGLMSIFQWNSPQVSQEMDEKGVGNTRKYHGYDHHELLGRRCGMPDACRLSAAFGVVEGDS